MKKIAWSYYHFTQVYHKWQSYNVWFLRYEVQQTEFFVSLGQFLPFYFPNNLENQNFEKVKKVSGDVIILHKWTIDDNHMMYGSWDMKCNKQNVLSSWAIFCLFISITTRKTKILKKWKKHLEMSSFYRFVSQAKIIWCIVPEIWSATDRICATGFFVNLGHFLPFLSNHFSTCQKSYDKNLNILRVK